MQIKQTRALDHCPKCGLVAIATIKPDSQGETFKFCPICGEPIDVALTVSRDRIRTLIKDNRGEQSAGG